MTTLCGETLSDIWCGSFFSRDKKGEREQKSQNFVGFLIGHNRGFLDEGFLYLPDMKLRGKVRKNILRVVDNSFGVGLAWHSKYIFSKCVPFSLPL